jgi:hypothetical protein
MENIILLAFILFLSFHIGKFIIKIFRLFFTFEGRDRAKKYLRSTFMKFFTILVGVIGFILLILLLGFISQS